MCKQIQILGSLRRLLNQLQFLVGLLSMGILAMVGPPAWAQSVDDIEPLLQQGKIKTALQRLDVLLAEDPENAKARFLKGLALAEDEQYSEAIKILLNLTIDYPKAPQIYNNLGIIYTRIERYEDAVEMFKKAFRVDPEYGEAYENLGDIYVMMAGVAYTGALAIDTENTAVHEKLASLDKLANILEQDEQPGRIQKPQRQPTTSRPRVQAAPPQTADRAPGDRPGWRVAGEQASPPTPEVSAESGADIEEMLLDWATAWSTGDINAYLAFYDDEFTPANDLSYEEWERQRRERITPSKTISIKLEKIAIDFQGGDDARAKFIQHYRSADYRDRVNKLLVLKLRAGEWRIVQELIPSS